MPIYYCTAWLFFCRGCQKKCLPRSATCYQAYFAYLIRWLWNQHNVEPRIHPPMRFHYSILPRHKQVYAFEVFSILSCLLFSSHGWMYKSNGCVVQVQIYWNDFFLTKSSLETCGYRIYVPMKRAITNTVKSSCYSFNSFSQGQVSSTLFLFKPFFSINCLALFRYFGQVSVVYLNHFFQ